MMTNICKTCHNICCALISNIKPFFNNLTISTRIKNIFKPKQIIVCCISDPWGKGSDKCYSCMKGLTWLTEKVKMNPVGNNVNFLPVKLVTNICKRFKILFMKEMKQ